MKFLFNPTLKTIFRFLPISHKEKKSGSSCPSVLLIGTILICNLLLSSCFTGIESTKKINLSREDKRLSNPTPEEQFMSRVESTPLEEWDSGRRFLVSDDKALLVIVPQQGVLPVAPDSVKGKVFEFTGIESKINAAGLPTVVILFSDGLFIYAYDTGKEFQDAMQNVKSDQIPMLIDLEMVEEAKKILTGQHLWSRTNLWYDKDGNRINGKKFVEVTITDVNPGDMVFPLWVEFKTSDNDKSYVFMNFGSAENESRAFNNIFSLTDIKRHYPGIDQETWEFISAGRVKPGMTKEEVRLALGHPTNANSGHDYSQTLDVWTYDNGKVLWFQDGRLTKIRQ